jgi:hypothetical protein
MEDAGIDPQIKQHVLHHKSIESQLVYTDPTIDKVTRALDEATKLLDRGRNAPQPDFTLYGFEDVDPLGLFSGPKPLLKGKS